ncbi:MULTISPECIES: SMI1/KNR4 family protein [unclassified Corallococcus]|uniref:SMI1/KNR4 family protein n=1 Tax=unclassified Corallococcus TaxID=2685029 RepID=UPI001A8C8C41|nr:MULTISPECIES: SMI1/KNR4 family protein [unclassified Corallococcus]MBN9687436.1 SMI1/KNR4 family protein [Corallococcus sp. NCSPR001]WAS88741.1 SMI1/KNR4 family protein [Corallococcus sp. NCRR]
MIDPRFPARLLEDLAQGRSTEGPRTRLNIDRYGDESEELPAALVPFARDGGGGAWYLDVEDALKKGVGAIFYLHMSETYGDTRYVAASYDELLQRVAEGLRPSDLPTFDELASRQAPKNVRVPGIEGLVDVKQVYASTGTPGVVTVHDDARCEGGFVARAGTSVYISGEGRIQYVTLAERAIVDGIACAGGTDLALNPRTGRPLRFTPAEPLVVDGIPLAPFHEVTVEDPISSPGVSGMLARDHDVDGFPLAGGTRVVLLGDKLSSGTLRADADVAGTRLPAGTWFELVAGLLFRTRPPAA